MSNASNWLSDIPESPEPDGQMYPRGTDEVRPLRELERYADAGTLRRSNGWLLFSAGGTPGQVCVGETQDYSVPIDDVLDLGLLQTCMSTGVVYRKIKYQVA